MARNIDVLVEHRRHNSPPPPMLAAWFQGLAADLKERLFEFGLLDSGAKPIADHLKEYERVLKARGNSPLYTQQAVNRIDYLLKGSKAAHWADLQDSKVQAVIAECRASKTMRATAQTQNAYLRDMKVGGGRWAASAVAGGLPQAAARVEGAQ